MAYSRWDVANRENVEQINGRDEVEPWKCKSLRLQVVGERLLTQYQFRLYRLQSVVKVKLVGRLNNIL